MNYFLPSPTNVNSVGMETTEVGLSDSPLCPQVWNGSQDTVGPQQTFAE